MDLIAYCSGAKIKSAFQLRSNRIRWTVAGVIGMSGQFVRASAVAVYRCNSDNAIIQRPSMAARFALANGSDTKRAMSMCALRMSPAFGHSNAPVLTMKRSAESNTIGCHISIAVSIFCWAIQMRCRRCSFNGYFTCTDDACELFCTDSEDTLIVPWGDSAADGTPCNIGTNDMCISGICRVSFGHFAVAL